MQVMGQTMKMTKESTEMYEIYGELNLLHFSIGYDTEQWRREEESIESTVIRHVEATVRLLSSSGSDWLCKGH